MAKERAFEKFKTHSVITKILAENNRLRKERNEAQAAATSARNQASLIP